MGSKQIKRRNYFIEKGLQFRFILNFCIAVVVTSLATVLFLYAFQEESTTVSFENLRAVAHTTTDYLVPSLIGTVLVSTVIVGLAAILLSLRISHKIAGPLYRFKKELDTIESGDLRNEFRIRKWDELQDVAASLNRTIQKLRSSIKAAKEQKGNLDHFKV